jgi:hypothetical protein
MVDFTKGGPYSVTHVSSASAAAVAAASAQRRAFAEMQRQHGATHSRSHGPSISSTGGAAGGGGGRGGYDSSDSDTDEDVEGGRGWSRGGSFLGGPGGPGYPSSAAPGHRGSGSTPQSSAVAGGLAAAAPSKAVLWNALAPALALPSGNDTRAFGFSLVAPGLRIVAYAASARRAEVWVRSIEAAIAMQVRLLRGGYSESLSHARTSAVYDLC